MPASSDSPERQSIPEQSGAEPSATELLQRQETVEEEMADLISSEASKLGLICIPENVDGILKFKLFDKEEQEVIDIIVDPEQKEFQLVSSSGNLEFSAGDLKSILEFLPIWAETQKMMEALVKVAETSGLQLKEGNAGNDFYFVDGNGREVFMIYKEEKGFFLDFLTGFGMSFGPAKTIDDLKIPERLVENLFNTASLEKLKELTGLKMDITKGDESLYYTFKDPNGKTVFGVARTEEGYFLSTEFGEGCRSFGPARTLAELNVTEILSEIGYDYELQKDLNNLMNSTGLKVVKVRAAVGFAYSFRDFSGKEIFDINDKRTAKGGFLFGVRKSDGIKYCLAEGKSISDLKILDKLAELGYDSELWKEINNLSNSTGFKVEQENNIYNFIDRNGLRIFFIVDGRKDGGGFTLVRPNYDEAGRHVTDSVLARGDSIEALDVQSRFSGEIYLEKALAYLRHFKVEIEGKTEKKFLYPIAVKLISYCENNPSRIRIIKHLFEHQNIIEPANIEEFLQEPALKICEVILDITDLNVPDALKVARYLLLSGTSVDKVKQKTPEEISAKLKEIEQTRVDYKDLKIFEDRNVVVIRHSEKWRSEYDVLGQKWRPRTDEVGTMRFMGPEDQEKLKLSMGANAEERLQVLGLEEDNGAREEAEKVRELKTRILNSIANTPPPATFLIEAHGGPDGIYLCDGVKQPSTTEPYISSEEILGALKTRNINFGGEEQKAELCKDIFYFGSCFGHTFIRKLIAGIQRNSLQRPVFAGTAEMGQLGYSKAIETVLGLGKQGVTMGEVYSNEAKHTSTDFTIYVSGTEGSYTQIVEAPKDEAEIG